MLTFIRELGVTCKAFEQLENDWQRAQTSYSYLSLRENSWLRRMSDQQSKEHAKAAREKGLDLSNQIISHQQTCAECKGS